MVCSAEGMGPCPLLFPPERGKTPCTVRRVSEHCACVPLFYDEARKVSTMLWYRKRGGPFIGAAPRRRGSKVAAAFALFGSCV